jgi:hypothetical protein
MSYQYLLDSVEANFRCFKKPDIIHNAKNEEDAKKGSYPAVQEDFGNLVRENMSHNDCIEMIYELSVISDEAVFYFLPNLSKTVLCDEGNELFFYSRLESINTNCLSHEQKKVILELIEAAKKKEEIADQEVELENSKWLNRQS